MTTATTLATRRTPAPTTTPALLAPHTMPCEISMTGMTVRTLGIPGTQRGVTLLRDQGITALWRPSSQLAQPPYAFVALDGHVHVVWFDAGRYVSEFEATACGRSFSTVDLVLWSYQQPPGTVGPCRDCMRVWRSRHG